MPPLAPSFKKKYVLYGGGALVLLIIILSVYASFISPASQEAGPTFDESFEFVPSTLFVCDDESTFRTEFPDDDRVQIIIDNTVVREVPRAYAPLGIRYEDTGWIYAFQGAGLTVTRKSDYDTAVCTQVAEGRKAPLNFGG